MRCRGGIWHNITIRQKTTCGEQIGETHLVVRALPTSQPSRLARGLGSEAGLVQIRTAADRSRSRCFDPQRNLSIHPCKLFRARASWG